MEEIRMVKINDIMWFALNDLPLNRPMIRKKLQFLRENANTKRFEYFNSRIIKNADLEIIEFKNFKDRLNNTGEKFGTKELVENLIMSSRQLTDDVKKEVLEYINSATL